MHSLFGGGTGETMAQRLKIAGTLQTRAAFDPATFDDAAGTVEVVFTTGARGLRNSWSGPYYEELEISERALDLSRLNNGAPLMDDHPYRRGEGGTRTQVGVVEKAWIAGKQARALVRFSDREEVKPLRADVKNGIVRHVSPGYFVQKMEKVAEVEKVPVYRATRWQPFEISFTPIAFDDRATVRGLPAPEFYEVEILSTAEESRAMEQIPLETPAAGTPAAPQPTPVAAPVPDLNATRSAELIAQGATAERERVTAIRSLVAKHKLGGEFEAKLIASPTSIEQVRALVLDEIAARSSAFPPDVNAGHRAEAGEDRRDKFVRGAGAWLLERSGMVGMMERAKQLDPRSFKALDLDGAEFRGMTLMDLARESLEARGFRTRGLTKMDLVGQAFMTRAGQTTSDFAVLFESVLHKMLLGSYVITEDTWSKFCKKDTVPDFRPSNRYRTGELGSLDVVLEGAEYKNLVLPDGQKSTISTETLGKILSVTRQAIINDDMSALADRSTKLGRAARLSIEKAVYALLNANSGLGPTQADAQPFFHANRANVNATGSAISVAGIDADRVIMRKQMDPNSQEYIDVRPVILLVPTGLDGEAKVINAQEFETTDNKFQKPNKVRGLFREVVDSPRLTSTTRRYLFADPAVAPAIVVAFLEGQGEGPVIETQDGWRVDGVDMKVRIDAKAQMFDPKGAVTNAGQ